MPASGVVVVGSANIDLTVEVDHRPVGGETVLGSDLAVGPGGKGANQAVAAARLGASTAFVGCVGGDGHGALLRAGLERAGVDVAGLTTVDRPTGTALIVLTEDAENSIIVSPGANAALTCEAVDRAVDWSSAAVVVTQLEIPIAVVEHLAEEAPRRSTRFVLNAAPARPLDRAVLAAADPLVVNESEAAVLLGSLAVAPEQVVAELMGLGPRSVVLTLGAVGSTWGSTHPHDTPTGFEPARRVEAVDTTGAGDGFVGALAAALARGWSLDRAVRLATDTAAHAVTGRGAQASYPTSAELKLEWM